MLGFIDESTIPVLGVKSEYSIEQAPVPKKSIKYDDKELEDLLGLSSVEPIVERDIITLPDGVRVFYCESYNALLNIKGNNDDIAILKADESGIHCQFRYFVNEWSLITFHNSSKEAQIAEALSILTKYGISTPHKHMETGDCANSYIDECDVADKGNCIVLNNAVDIAKDESYDDGYGDGYGDGLTETTMENVLQYLKDGEITFNGVRFGIDTTYTDDGVLFVEVGNENQVIFTEIENENEISNLATDCSNMVINHLGTPYIKDGEVLKEMFID